MDNRRTYIIYWLGGWNMDTWYPFRPEHNRKARITTDRGPEHAWEIFQISQDLHIRRPDLVYGKNIKVEEDPKTREMRYKSIMGASEKDRRFSTGHHLVCPSCGGYMGPDRFCWECDNNR